MTSGIPQGLVLGKMLFYVFIVNMDCRIEFPLSKFIFDTKLCGVLTTQGRDASKATLTGLRGGTV